MKNNSTIRLAVDLGTTTVNCCLFDEYNKKVLEEQSFLNPQSLYGRDVLTRITACIKHSENESKMQIMLANALEKAFTEMLEKSKLQTNAINKICICGNTTMIGILMGYDLTEMGNYPFTPPFKETIVCKAGECCLSFLPAYCEVIISGCAGAFIGGDILSGLYFLEKTQLRNNIDMTGNMLIDLGTNGEMAIWTEKGIMATSAACGPAFENCTRRQNVYGSSVIDAISLCLKTHKIDKYGILADEYHEKGIDIMGLHLDMDIIREIILAKAAIRTGIDYLIKEAGYMTSDIKKVYIAGGFGFYLNINNAALLGLIPVELIDKVVIMGNTSLNGATTASAKDLDSYIGRIRLISLTDIDDYNDKLLNNMVLGE